MQFGFAQGEVEATIFDLRAGALFNNFNILVAQLKNTTARNPRRGIDAKKAIGMFNINPINVPIMGVVENMAYFVAPGDTVRHDIFGSGLKLLVATPLLVEGGPDAFMLAGLFDLTPSEARVAQSLAAGIGTGAAASRLGLSRETVRSHVKAILAKTNTRGQAELAALLGSARLGRKGRADEGEREV